MVDKLGGRKLAMCLVATAVGLCTVILRGDLPPNFLSLFEFILGAFVAGNGVEHISKAVSSRKAIESKDMDLGAETQPPPDDNSIEDKIDLALNSLTMIQKSVMVLLERYGKPNQ